MEKPDITARENNPLCGDSIELFLQLDGQQRVKEVKFQGQGCAVSQSSISMLTEELKGKHVSELEKLATKEHIFELLGVPISHARMKCALLSMDVLLLAMKDYHAQPH
ncbi:MAG: iron-sulfur cluster assembly scaffold protein [Halobacteriales archaeon]|nr:iron-sulfur cluster assembly scaffold protein [Halobacteriales archaeon]